MEGNAVSYFNNLPTQLLGICLGWAFTVYLQSKANRRTESLKRKDAIIDLLLELPDWLEDQFEKEEIKIERLEENYSSSVSRIEIKIGQFNIHTGGNVIECSGFNDLRTIDLTLKEKDETVDQIRTICFGISDEVEECCNELFFSNTSFYSKTLQIYKDLQGALLALVALFVLFILIKVYN